MTPTTFYPTKLRKERVQFSGEDLKLLVHLVTVEIDHRKVLEMGLTDITRLWLKLARALERASA